MKPGSQQNRGIDPPRFGMGGGQIENDAEIAEILAETSTDASYMEIVKVPDPPGGSLNRGDLTLRTD
jgi:hypothetical protein